MSFSSTNLRKIVEGGFSDQLGGMWRYNSSDSSTQIIATGYFAAVGYGSKVNNLGMRVGDIVLNQESSGGATPGRVTLHGVTASTFNQASTSASSAFQYGYDCTVTAAAT